MKQNTGKGDSRKPARKVGKHTEPTFTLTELVKASKLAEDLGGVEHAKELLNAISKLS